MTIDESKFAAYACHGLGIIQPINEISLWLGHELGIDFHIVGGADPRIWQATIEERLLGDVSNGKEIIWVGHSMGAALGFYLPQKHPKWRFRCIATVDPMSWASNMRVEDAWQARPSQPGLWRANGTVAWWVNIRTSQYPGGGRMVTVTPPRFTDHHFPQYGHIDVIVHSDVRGLILSTIQESLK